MLAPETTLVELESRIQAALEAQAEALRAEEETGVEAAVSEETGVEEAAAPAEPIRGLW